MKKLMNSIMCGTLMALLSLASFAAADAQTSPAGSKPKVAPKSFASTQEAVDALLKAAQENSLPALLEIFGSDAEDIAASADPVQQKNNTATFTALAQQKKTVTVDPRNKNRAILAVGNEDWPFPITLAKKHGRWYFDTLSGRNEIIFRRIGANELDAIEICRGFVEAQKEYAAEIRDGSGIHQYAQKMLSSPGKQDGLYWKNADGTPGGPISETIAKAIEEGYSPAEMDGYHGYYFRVLRGQGPAAPLGRMDYLINGAMIGGFALIAVPADYGHSGVKSFMVSHDGIVYEKDLGPDTLNIAKKIDLYNPDKTWKRTDAEWPPEAQ